MGEEGETEREMKEEEEEVEEPGKEEGGKVREEECTVDGKMKIQEGENRVKGDANDVLIMNENNKKGEELDLEMERKNGRKGDGDSEEEECIPPALPPRPPPRTARQSSTCNCTCDFTVGELGFQQRFRRTPSRSCWASGLRKYVFLCTACGSLSILLGTLFLTVYFMLKSYTSSLNHFETIPTYVPSGMLIATGFLIICLACRKNRKGFLMKLCGLCSLCCAVLCVSVTVTTTVIHMNRLQTLRECLYTQKTQSCTCYSVLMDNDRTSDEGIKFVFNSTPDCEVVHGALYSCLRAIFGLSVIGILVCIFSCMLVYQLLSHEKKKMYWAQLEMRCRYLYRQQRNPHYCSCCDECRYPPPPHEIFPWELMGNRFWSSGRIGNLYTPNPEDRDGNNRLRSAWNWRRLPWNRSGSSGNEPSRTNLGSPDSQYGFSSTPTVDGAPYTVLDPRATTCPTGVPPGTDITEGGFYSWGPPPPYASNRNSANNSPARRSLGEILHQVSPIRRNDNISPIRPYHHVHHHHVHHPHTVSHQCTSSSRQVTQSNLPTQSNCPQKSIPSRAVHMDDLLQQQRHGMENNVRSNSLTSVHRFQKIDRNKDNYENTYESEIFPSTNGFNTLPSLKKRNQTRVSDLFQNETTSAYYFSSAENLGCAESNDGQFRNETLPPRIFLLNDTPRTSSPRYDSSGYPKGSTDSEHQSEVVSRKNILSAQGTNRAGESGNSFVKKLFVSCSPTKQKPEGNIGEKNILQTNSKKKSGKRAANKDADPSNENVITFHYRLGIPRSPNIHNFGALKACENSKEDVGSENGGEESQEKVLKGIKYASKDAELLQKHGSLMKEFNKNVDLQRNLKHKSEKSPGRGSYVGVDNRGFQIMEEFTRAGYPSKSTEYRTDKYSESQGEDFHSGKNENESDVYFGDISNSSCYVSMQNEGAESSLYEEAVEHRGGQPLLNKQNLKRIEKENGESYDHPDTTNYNKLSESDYQQGYRSRKQFRYNQENSEGKKEEARAGPSQEGRSQRRQYLVSSNVDNKYFTGGGCYSDHYRQEHYQEASNDEHSSSSLTVDSGISTGRNYLPRCYDATYQEIECKETGETSSFETLNERFSNMDKFQPGKIQNANNLSEFPSHSIFQKPKAIPRGTRDPRHKKGYDKDPEVPRGKTSGEGQPEITEETYSKQKEEGKSPKPLPRTSLPHGKYQQKEKHFLAPDAQYEYKTEFKQKSQTIKVDSGKPVVPARPVNLQERCRNPGFGYCKTEGGCPLPRRRPPPPSTNHGDTDGKDNSDIASHSVNV